MKRLKKNIIPLLCIISLVILSCNSNGKSNDNKNSKEVAEEKNDDKFNKAGEQDANALIDAYSQNMLEMQLSDSIQRSLRYDETKNLANAISSAHADVARQIKSLASQKAISLPTDLTQDQRDKINDMRNKKANEIDKAYTNWLKDNHKDAISKYEKAAGNSNDPDIKSWFSNNTTELRKHLDLITSTEEKIKNR